MADKKFMKNQKHTIAALFFVFSCLFSFEKAFSSDEEKASFMQEGIYRLLVEEYSGDKKCTGLSLVKTCGNRVCDDNKGETVENCPFDCSKYFIASHNKQTVCEKVRQVASPRTVEEVSNLVRQAYEQKIPVKAVGSRHSATSLLCGEGMVLEMMAMNKIYGLDENKETVLVDAGVRLNELTEYLDLNERSLGFALMGLRVITVAGAMATGSHGSSPNHRGILSYLATELEIVNGEGKILTFKKSETEETLWKALVANLGMMGIVTKVRLAVEKQFNLDVKVKSYSEKKLFEEESYRENLAGCDYAIFHWFPQKKKFLKICGSKTEKEAEVGAENILLSPKFPSFIISPYKQAMHLASCYKGLSRLLEKVRYYTLKLFPPFAKEVNGKIKSRGHVIGKSHLMISSKLSPFEQAVFQRDWEFALPLKDAVEAINWLKKYIKKEKSGLPLFGIFLRHALIEDESLMTHAGAGGKFKKGDTAVYVEIVTFYPNQAPSFALAEYEKFYSTIVEKLVKDFNGRPHWAKNEDSIHAMKEVKASYGDRWEKFEKIREIMDPEGIFQNGLTKVLKLD